VWAAPDRDDASLCSTRMAFRVPIPYPLQVLSLAFDPSIACDETLRQPRAGMTNFEVAYTLLRSFEHPLYHRLWKTIRRETRARGPGGRVLDVGGRRSNYTIGLPADITITDLPRETALQSRLDLGATDTMRESVLARRSNVRAYVYDDMTTTSLPPGRFDVVVAVEVLEHVQEHVAFVRNVARVIRPPGLFLMTTPNGDYRRTPRGDHKRHYTRRQLRHLLSRYFAHVEVDYAVNTGRLFRWGNHRWSVRTPARTLASMICYTAARWAESLGAGGQGPLRKHHLIAACRHPVRLVERV
jgi:2-polyprenyl-3-methyl-5-hydroxy-6-metoxy-1,4-benzoquinol methylase